MFFRANTLNYLKNALFHQVFEKFLFWIYLFCARELFFSCWQNLFYLPPWGCHWLACVIRFVPDLTILFWYRISCFLFNPFFSGSSLVSLLASIFQSTALTGNSTPACLWQSPWCWPCNGGSRALQEPSQSQLDQSVLVHSPSCSSSDGFIRSWRYSWISTCSIALTLSIYVISVTRFSDPFACGTSMCRL